jgi:hypothetical protein
MVSVRVHGTLSRYLKSMAMKECEQAKCCASQGIADTLVHIEREKSAILRLVRDWGECLEGTVGSGTRCEACRRVDRPRTSAKVRMLRGWWQRMGIIRKKSAKLRSLRKWCQVVGWGRCIRLDPIQGTGLRSSACESGTRRVPTSNTTTLKYSIHLQSLVNSLSEHCLMPTLGYAI